MQAAVPSQFVCPCDGPIRFRRAAVVVHLNECPLLPYHPERLDIWIGTECLWTPAIPQQGRLQDHFEDRLLSAVGSVEGRELEGRR